ncbi:unnamed protein product [Closterium sp. Yama58-4]|nr:unnamed protein product [Closterium sp. Yama58-4]
MKDDVAQQEKKSDVGKKDEEMEDAEEAAAGVQEVKTEDKGKGDEEDEDQVETIGDGDDTEELAVIEAEEVEEGDDGEQAGDDDEMNDVDEEEIEPAEEDDPHKDEPHFNERKEIARKERERLREMKRNKKRELEELIKRQNDAVQAETADSAKGRLKFLLQQTEIFQHFAQQHDSPVKPKGKGRDKGRGRGSSKLTEEEEDEEYLKEEEEALGDGGSTTRLLVQPSCIQGKMRDYQLAGLNWMIRLYENGINGILADEMGLGKTLQSISLLGYLHEFKGISGPHMVVAPKSTLGNWIKELNRFCPVLRAFKFHGNQEERAHQRTHMLQPGKFDVVVTSYEMVIKEKSAFRRLSWRYIIIDEAHRIKNENSILSKTMRLFSSNYRLLITGTPLQNNLHELWALLNFLLPEIFSSAEAFDEWFQLSDGEDQQEVVQQLHKVLRPFLLRRLKSDVERGLPPKKETILKVGMSEVQRNYYRALLQKDIDVLNSGGERSRLLNIAMQLRKCCNHPYLFQGAEPGPPFITDEHLIEASGKMVLLDRLLPKLKARDSRVLIFSQMTRLLDILEDYCMFRGHQYCRIDGNTGGDEREAAIEEFNKEGSETFIFLLSTRAGGLGINLATADIVIIYDSDWNPQADLQAMDRAHRIGQKKEVQVFRFCTEHTIEEKVIERAYKKLALDALIIQQGRLAEQRAVNKDELLQMVRFGAEKVFTSANTTITDADVDRIIAKGEEATAELDAKMRKFTEDAIKFKMDDTALYSLGEGEKEEERPDLKKLVTENWVEPSRRERKKNYSEAEYYRQAMRMGPPSQPKSKEARLPKMPVLHDFQFFNTARLSELFDKEAKAKLVKLFDKKAKAKLQALERQAARKEAKEGGEPFEEDDEQPILMLTDEEQEEKLTLLNQGFKSWTRKDFNQFLRLCEKYGRADVASIAAEMEGKTEAEVREYAAVFWERCTELNDVEGKTEAEVREYAAVFWERCTEMNDVEGKTEAEVREYAAVFWERCTELNDVEGKTEAEVREYAAVFWERCTEMNDVEGKTEAEVREYAAVFWERCTELNDVEGKTEAEVREYAAVFWERCTEMNDVEGKTEAEVREYAAVFWERCTEMNDVEGKTEAEVRESAAVFWERCTELNDWDKILRNIEKGEARIVRREEIMQSVRRKMERYSNPWVELPQTMGQDSTHHREGGSCHWDKILRNIEKGEARIVRREEIMQSVRRKMERYSNPWVELRIQYGTNKGKYYTEESDRFMICMIQRLGYGNWDELRAAVRQSHLFKFDWFLKSRQPPELARRCDTLIRLVEKENQELEEKERQAKRDKKNSAKVRWRFSVKLLSRQASRRGTS